ncbi:putative O-succinylbenzoic acid--CoA ligase MenE [Gordonia spumicola]|uniref:Putative O-succinylbenzoic acid--CoA ligase MenE n=1 Tax=Gordonia spumicola TaxID=589161 RepID=A0A7I9V396_9ACTN|nr:o-succinylbenzoate--CoA ligase [Gordonia spumicola]GED99686.1 putative O-succinylbenzoic acid--CoA ligase MenE [Gordonia spumicola]
MLRARRDLSALLAGDAAYLPLPDVDSNESTLLRTHLGVGAPVDDRCALVVSTSGTTGVPKGAMHTAATLAASAEATAVALGGPGAWLQTLPPHHIAGLQVMLRSIAAGADPVVVDVSAGFDPAVLPAAADALDGPRRYTSLVPVQLRKALAHPPAVNALRTFDAILVGGAATPPALQRDARDAGLAIVTTYGMSETAGGCVYDGVPLRGTTIRIDAPNDDGVGRVVLGGSTVALGYRNRPDHPAFAEPGWFRTDDLGVVRDGVLSIVGRADEAVSTGGLTVIPQVVEAVIAELPAVGDCAVVGLPDERLGERVVVAVVPAEGRAAPTLDEIREFVVDRLDRYAAPREVFVLDSLPLRGPGKVNRAALRELLS